jgi:hypothetical protein
MKSSNATYSECGSSRDHQGHSEAGHLPGDETPWWSIVDWEECVDLEFFELKDDIDARW